MTKLVIQHRGADESVTTVVLKIENDYPDALDQAKRTALDTLAEALAYVGQLVTEDEA